MNERLAHGLRRRAEVETAGRYPRARMYTSDDNGTIWLVGDCTRGLYRELKRKVTRPYDPHVPHSAMVTVEALRKAKNDAKKFIGTERCAYCKPSKKAPHKRRNTNAVRIEAKPTAKSSRIRKLLAGVSRNKTP